MMSSDGLAHSMRRLIETHRLDVLRNITELLSRTFTSQFVFPVLGHEDGQANNYRRLGDLWRLWLPLEALQTFEKGLRIFILSQVHSVVWFVFKSIDERNVPSCVFILLHFCQFAPIRWILYN